METETSLRVLLADNLPEFLQTRAEYLQKAGYDVLLAESPEQIVDILETERVHLAILDIRLRDNDDEKDISGLTIAKDSRYRHIPKIMLTNFPSYQLVRDALGPSNLADLPPAVDFLDKKEGAQAMIAAVRQAIQQYVAINPAIRFSWETTYLSFAQLHHMIQPTAVSHLRNERILMIEDMFRRLFKRYEQVSFGQVLHRESGRLLIAASTFDADDRQTQFIVSFGLSDAIAGEERRYQQDVPEQARGFLAHQQTVYSLHFAAIAYVFNGGDLDNAQSLRLLFQHRELTQITQGLSHLYHVQLPLWQGRGRTYNEAYPLVHFLSEQILSQVDKELLQNSIEAICQQALATNLADIAMKPAHLSCRFGSELLVWPNPSVYHPRLSDLSLPPVHWGGTHGRVNIDTVLVNERGRTWLIDYAFAGQAPLLIDYVSLEMSILQEVATGLDFAAMLDLEKLLLSVKTLDADFSVDEMPAAVHAALSAIEMIRRETAVSAGCDLTAYEAARFAFACRRLAQFDTEQRYRRLSLLPFAGALLTASLTAQKLWASPAPVTMPPGKSGLWIDHDNETAWIAGRQVELTVQDFQILSYLFKHAGQLCEHRDIVEQAIGEPFDGATGQDESRLYNAVRRLRQKIEIDPARPQFLKTVRGRGYRLELPTDD